MKVTQRFCPALLLAGLLLAPVQGLSAQPGGQRPQAAGASATTFLPPVLPGQAKGTVARAMDGDTLKLADGRMVRLACVDAPDLVSSYSRDVIEKNRRDFRELNLRTEARPQSQGRENTSRFGQFYSVRSRKALAEAAAKKRVVLHAGALKRDRQKRIIADAVLEHGRSLSAHLVMNGLAYVVFDRDFPPEYQEVLLKLQRRAMRARRGFWDRILGMEAAKRTYTGDRETKLFYAASDVRGLKVKPRMRVYFGNLLDAFNAGFAPARSTDFWPPSASGGK